jgi:hypothetical protein
VTIERLQGDIHNANVTDVGSDGQRDRDLDPAEP